MSKPAADHGSLFVVATPIGNLGDISSRALDVLRSVDLIAAEDTRHSGRLLQHFNIDSRLVSLHEHNESARLPELIDTLAAGKSVALVSDAGTPLISDPGFQLVREARRRQLPVVPVPGACSPIAALSVAGLATDRFQFEGFLPARSAARRQRLQQLADCPQTLVLLESPRRIRATLADLCALCGAERMAFVARELTKLYEESRLDSLSGLCAWLDLSDPRGEYVVAVAGAPAAERTLESAEGLRVLTLLLAELPLKRAVLLAAAITGENKNRLYEMALSIKD